MMNIIMNYLITTFDGIGDGGVYFPIFNEIGNKLPRSKFFYTSNIFFEDSSITDKIELPLNFRVIDNNFRKFPKEHWEIIYFRNADETQKVELFRFAKGSLVISGFEFPVFREPFGRAVIESLARGTPV